MPESTPQKQRMKNTLIAPILTGVILLLLILSNFIDRDILQYQDNLYLSVIILYLLILIMPGIFYSKLKGTGYVDKLNIKMFGLNKVPYLIFVFLAMASATMIFKLLQYGMGIYSVQITYFDRYLPSNPLTSANILYVIIAYAILPAICEEFIFRGILLTEYADCGTGQVNTIFLTAILYAMSYTDFAKFPVYFLTGFVFAMIVFVTQSLIASTIMHIIYNLFMIYVEDYMMRLASQAGNLLMYIFIMLACVLIFVIVAFGCAEKIYYTYSIEKENVPPYADVTDTKPMKRFADAAIAPSYIICLILFIAAAILI